ncbi:MAG: type I glyceraldehyde-3-phosphate dehydrogenase [Actinomycetaceae bacterium]|nr:type I glyceraldehyde-3-phosphate dehydrogenase [Actinomycetaceae bacterium]
MTYKVAINGFGRIGRLALRQIVEDDVCDVVAINTRGSKPKMLAHLLKYDSTQGMFNHDITHDDDSIYVDGKQIRTFTGSDARQSPWGELGIDLVAECTGAYTSKEKSQAHLDAGAKKVVVSAPAGSDVPTIVYNVNHETLKAEDTIISTASCTTNCLAPMAKALNNFVPIRAGIMTTVHSYTGDQKILDAPHKDVRRARSGAFNIVPNTTGAAKAIGLVIPELDGKLIGSSQRIPTPTGSTTLLYAVVGCDDELTIADVNAAMKNATNETYGYTDDPIVSSDIIGMRYGSLFDATQTMVEKYTDHEYLVQAVAWYDNENSYVSQMVRTINYYLSL